MGGVARQEQAGLSCCVLFIPPQVPLASDWGELMGGWRNGMCPSAEKFQKGSNLMIAAAAIAQQLRITRHDRRSAPPTGQGGWRGM